MDFSDTAKALITKQLVRGLKEIGYREIGGSQIYRLLENSMHGVKIFWNVDEMILRESYEITAEELHTNSQKGSE